MDKVEDLSQLNISDADSDTDPDSLFNRIEEILENDNKDAFVSLVKVLSEEHEEHEISEAYFNMFRYDSVACFAAMLAGEAGEKLNIGYYMAIVENLPLHDAARSLKVPKITALLLEKGYDANYRSAFISKDVCLENALPLNVALETFRAYQWNGGSAVMLITSLYGYLWESKKGITTRDANTIDLNLETIATLARNTKAIKFEFYEYLKRGMMVEVGILLAVASDRLLYGWSPEEEEDISFWSIYEMQIFLKNEMDMVSAHANCKDQLLEMQMTRDFLEIFDKIRDKLIAQTQFKMTSSEVESLIKDAGFDLEVVNGRKFRGFVVNISEGGFDDEWSSHASLPVPSTLEEQELVYQAYNSGQIPVAWSVLDLPSRITVTVDRTWFTEKQAIDTGASGIEV